MKIYKQTVYMTKAKHEEALRVMATEDLGGVDNEHILTAQFPDGREMDIQAVCHGKGNSWVEAVLYYKAYNNYDEWVEWWEVLGSTGNAKDYLGEWQITDWNHDDPIVYKVEVVLVG